MSSNLNERYTNRHLTSVPPILWGGVLAVMVVVILLYLTSPVFRYFVTDVYRSIRTVELICPIEKGIYATTGLGVDVFYACLTEDVTTVYLSDLIKDTFFANLFLIPIGGFFAYKMLKKLDKTHPYALFNEPLTPDTAERLMEGKYPHITYFRRLNLVADDIRTGAIPSGMPVKDFILKNRLIESFERIGDSIEIYLDKDKVNQILIDQLGQTKSEFMQKYELCKRASIALFKDEHTQQSPRLQNEFKDAVDNLGHEGVLELFLIALAVPKVYCLDETITKDQETQALSDYERLADAFWHHFISAKSENNLLWYKTPLNHVNVAVDYFEKYGHTPEVVDALDRHAYVSTCIIRLYDKANLAPADVGWLRAYNRRLWYVIQNKGRPTAFIENAGAACHYNAEKANGGELSDPEMSNAISAMREVCNRTLFTLDELQNIK